MTATRSGSWMPRPRRNTASTIEYTAVVIATPTASERIAKVVKRGVAPSRLSASLRSRPTAVEGSTPGYRPITTGAGGAQGGAAAPGPPAGRGPAPPAEPSSGRFIKDGNFELLDQWNTIPRRT